MSIEVKVDVAVSISASARRAADQYDGERDEPLWNITRKANEAYSWLSTGDGRYIFIGDDDVDAFVELATALRDHVRASRSPEGETKETGT